MSIITLLTDFGLNDEYTGVMKGVILSINPSAVIVDITHQIDPQDIVQAAFTIQSTFRYFPAGTVHLVVVDPGVGTERTLLALEMKKQFFIAPDNGVLTLLFNENDITSLVRLTNQDFFLTTVSRTFHGRDIIAPIGAHITNGVGLEKLGVQIETKDVCRLDNLLACILENDELVGKIVAIDHFGNLITNIHASRLAELSQIGEENKMEVKVGPHVISGLSKTYHSVPAKTPLALIGSRGYLEIAMNQGDAGMFLKACKGSIVRVIA